MLASSSDVSGDVLTGHWFAEHENGNLYLELRGRGQQRRDHWNLSQSVPTSEFTGLEFTDDVEFSLKRDAGTFVFRGGFDGTGHAQEGDGSFTFTADPQYVAKLAELNVRQVDDMQLQVIALQDLKLATIQKMIDLGYGPFDDDEIVSMAIFRVTPEFVDKMADLGYDHVDADDLLAMRIHGATPDWIRSLEKKGIRHLSARDLIALRISGVKL